MKSILKILWQKITFLFGRREFLCDKCKYNFGNACKNPQRPNAMFCKDFVPRGK